MKKFSLFPRTKSGWLSVILLALLIPAYWDELQSWRIKRHPHEPAAPVAETAQAPAAGKTDEAHSRNHDAEHGGP